MLDAIIHDPRERREGSPTLVLLHGRGSDMGDLQGLKGFLPPDWTLVTPRAPFPGMPWGYGPGWAWYRYIAEDRVVDETLGESLQALDEFLGALPGKLGRSTGPLVLGGFSQGGTTSMAYAMSRPGSIPLVANFSGFVVDSPLVRVTPGTVAETEFFWGHGEADPAIPFALGLRGRETLGRADARLTTFDHPGGHTITREELEAFVGWIGERVDAPSPG